MLLATLAVFCGLVLLVWSAGWFIDGAAALAWYFGVPSILIGMLILGFGTSAPELGVSLLASLQGNSGIALGNAYGSNIANIALILGSTSLLSPIMVQSQILRKELPVLAAMTALVIWQMSDLELSRVEAAVLLVLFLAISGWITWVGMRGKSDPLAQDVNQELTAHRLSRQRAYIYLGAGIMVLLLSSRILVWGAVEIASSLGVSDVVVGLTVVAIGTSLPELASSVTAARRNEHEMVLGNIIGSNLFNCMAVAGLAGIIQPAAIDSEIYTRDLMVMALFTASIFIFGYGFRKPGRVNRFEGFLLLSGYVVYVGFLIQKYVVT